MVDECGKSFKLGPTNSEILIKQTFRKFTFHLFCFLMAGKLIM